MKLYKIPKKCDHLFAINLLEILYLSNMRQLKN